MMSEDEIKEKILPKLKYQVWRNSEYSYAYEKALYYVEMILNGGVNNE